MNNIFFGGGTDESMLQFKESILKLQISIGGCFNMAWN